MTSRVLTPLACAALTAVLAVTLAAAPAPRPKPQAAAKPPSAAAQAREELFETRVRPLFARHCASCHSAEKPSGGLSLADRASLLKGGARGPAVVPGKPDESPLLRALTHADPALKMPPSSRLPQAEIEAVRAWIRAGAVWPDAGAKDERPLWSVQPVRRRAAPRVNHAKWVRNPIDAFILAKLEAAGMKPAPPAGRRELIRRATFDLTGLPPTPEEIDAFLADARPDAYERLIDRLLASPGYGERWARHWLDLVRYADTNGYERDAEKPHSWKYRDYVIASLNADKPYDRFVMEQLAGDELPDRSEETLVATGFLRLGTWDDEPNDPVEYQYERLDDLVHVTSTAFLGLTVRCARCHDHKFDPIPQVDYYALGAAFWGGYLQPGDRELQGGPPKARLPEGVLAFTEAGPQPAPLHLPEKGDARREGPVVPPGFLSVVSQLRREVSPPPAGAASSHRRRQLAAWIVDPANPLTPRVLVNRLWQHHFGRGLVSTPNNFGRKGSPPTQPELLDWLSADLVRGGWRLKRMHRQLMLSSTYRMASTHPQEAAYSRKDAGNELRWRFDRRRLDADALRDAMLAVSGQLNRQTGGRGFTPEVNREALEGLSKKGAEWEVSPPDEQRRRSIYMFLKRALIPPFMTVFDFGDTTQPLEGRESSIVAPQALALMNGDFSHAQSLALAGRARAEAGAAPTRQVERLWRLALGRSPDPVERQAALAHLRKAREAAVAPPPAETPRPPDALPALRLWLRADRGVTLDGKSHVSRWEDLSGNGHHAAQPDSAARPELLDAALGGQRALRFDGNGRFLHVEGKPITSPGFTIVAVATDRGAGGHRELFSNWRRESNVGTSVFLGTTGAGSVRFSDVFAPAGTVVQPERPFALFAGNGTYGSSVAQNRTLLAERGSPLPDRNLAPPYVIGQQGNIGGEFWHGEIAELVVYDRPLSPQERDALCDYFAQRYGLAARPAPPAPEVRALASLAHVLLNANEFLFID
ncbi:MAG: DUF1549 domain-containing protein [Armatimonadota bacterium]